MTSLRKRGCRTLFEGERISRKCHDCDGCDRQIYSGENYYARVRLYAGPGEKGEMLVKRLCALCLRRDR